MFKEMIDMNKFHNIVSYYTSDRRGSTPLSSSVLEEMINTHVENKAHIFKLFGNKLKIEKEIETTVSDFEVRNILSELLEEFRIEKKLVFVKTFLSSLSTDEFISNVLERDRNFFSVPLQKGIKVSKALAKICPEKDAHRVITAHSMAYQKMSSKGKLVLSIDPCDYVTMSSNNSGWRSCHRLNGGEYQTGPIAYLRDNCTVICYLESSKPCEITYRGESVTHSNKVWRQIALVSPNLDYSIQERQYPAYNKINETEVAKLFKELFEAEKGISYDYKKEDTDELTRLHIDFADDNETCAYYYNDTYAEMYDEGYVVRPKDASIRYLRSNFIKPTKGERVYCLCCGEETFDSGELICCDCRYN